VSQHNTDIVYLWLTICFIASDS